MGFNSRVLSNAAVVLPPLVLETLLAIANGRLVRENRRSGDEAHFYEPLRRTPVGVVPPDLYGKGLDGRDLRISYPDGNRKTLLMVFSPIAHTVSATGSHRLDVATSRPETRVVFVNVGGPLPPNFSEVYSFDTATVVVQANPETILQCSRLEFRSRFSSHLPGALKRCGLGNWRHPIWPRSKTSPGRRGMGTAE